MTSELSTANSQRSALNAHDALLATLFRSFGQETQISLLAADADRVKDYVFESVGLPEIRGASAQLSALNDSGEIHKLVEEVAAGRFPEVPPECVIYAGGGSALLAIPTCIAGEVARRLQARHLRETDVATLSVVHQPLTSEQWVGGLAPRHAGFGRLWQWLGYRLRLAKESRAIVPFAPLPVHVRECDSCQRRPANEQVERPGGERRPLCRTCQRKQRWGREQKSRLLRDFEEYVRTRDPNSAYGGQLAASAEPPGSAPSLDEIGAAAGDRARGYVGLIYADGNSVGSRLVACDGPEEFRALSERLQRAAREAVFGALSRWPLLDAKGWFHAVEIITIGGDDVILVTPGDVALDVAADICKGFDEGFEGSLTMSAGVCVMPVGFPLYLGLALCQELLKIAKQRGREVQGDQPPMSMIDFQIISGDSALTSDVRAYRRQMYRVDDHFDNVLTERPYRQERLRRLLNLVRWIRTSRFPIGQLYHLRQAILDGGWARSINWHRYQIARSASHEVAYRDFHAQFANNLGVSPEHAPWNYDVVRSQFSTPILDLVEILDYVRTGKEGGLDGRS